MKVIVDETGEIIAIAMDDHILVGHHRLAVAGSMGKRLFWRDTGEPVELDHFFKHCDRCRRRTRHQGRITAMLNWMLLALESNRVIELRIAKLMRGGKAAQREALRMVSEKMLAAAKTGTSLMAGASADQIVEQYRRKVAANVKRLSQKRTRKRKSR